MLSGHQQGDLGLLKLAVLADSARDRGALLGRQGLKPSYSFTILGL